MIESNLHFLHQGIGFLQAIDPELFATTGGLAGRRGSIGAHLRHCIEFYRGFLDGVGEGRIDYDARQRDTAIEADPRAAEAALLEIVSGLAGLPDEPAEKTLLVKVDAAAWSGSTLEWSQSTLGRELQFLVTHTVHHFALIAMLARGRGFDPGDGFGVAPSTLEFEHRAATVAS